VKRPSIQLGSTAGSDAPGTQPESAAQADRLFQQATQLHRNGKIAQAEEKYLELLSHDPRHTQGLHYLAALHHQTGRYSDAIAIYERAVDTAPRDFAIRMNFANTLHQLGRFEDALVQYEHAAEVEPKNVDVQIKMGIVERALNRYRKAAERYAAALEIDPDNAAAHHNLANIFVGVRQFANAHRHYTRVMQVAPDMELVVGNWLLNMQQLCDWTYWEPAVKKVIADTKAGKMATPPFPTLASRIPADIKRKAAEIYTTRNFPHSRNPAWKGEIYNHDKIRVGFISADFREHAASRLTVEIYERLNRKRFEVYGFSLIPSDQSELRARLENAFDHFHQIINETTEQIVSLIRSSEIDILVDLGGHTSGSRTDVLAQRPAPVQINYLGFPGTMGASYIDYIIGDNTLIPPSHYEYYSEKIIVMPDCYQPTDSNKPVSDRNITRQECGLADDAFVYCTFNNNFKMTPDDFDVWMRILSAVPNAQFWLVEVTDLVRENLMKETEKRGISKDRIIFAQHAPYPEHLARHRCADLFLDCFHYNAGTMASEALWMGLPLLTCPGDNFSNRMAASLLNCLDLPELIASSHEDFEKRAIEFARDPKQLEAIKEKLVSHAKTHPLFDMARYTNNLENAFEQIVTKTRNGLPPDHILVGRQDEKAVVSDGSAPPQPTATEMFQRAEFLHRQNDYQAAEQAYERLLGLYPDHADGLNFYGVLKRQIGELDGSIALIEKSIAANPKHFGSRFNLAGVLRRAGKTSEALREYEEVVALKPDYADAHNFKGELLAALGRVDEAVDAFQIAIALQPDAARPLANLANLYLAEKQFEQASEYFQKANALDPDIELSEGNSLLIEQQLCRWQNWKEKVDHLAEGIEEGKLVGSPFALLATPIPANLKRQLAEDFTEKMFPPSDQPLWNGEIYNNDRIKIGYISADFRHHAVTFLTAELFERHDHDRFEIQAFSLCDEENTPLRQRLKTAFDYFHDLGKKSDDDIAQLIRSLDIDVLVDLGGFTGGARPSVLAKRPAPVQVSYLGFPGTTGAPYVDYVVADEVLIPRSHYQNYSEKVITLPDCYQPSDTRRYIAETNPMRTDFGLDPECFVYCSFNTNYKITPDVFDIWCRLLNATPASQLWLVRNSDQVTENLLHEAKARGVNPDRIIFAERLPLPDHLARHKCADLFLDSFHYNAGATASDALWMGLPLLTCPGDGFANRMATSLLSTLGIPELIADSPKEYERIALKLANNREKLSQIQSKLEANRKTSPLFSMERYTRHLEAAFTAATERVRAGLSPDHITVPAIDD
jgi:predicted O-linked N-acetylglucosamine transferase (SPINDLY family)